MKKMAVKRRHQVTKHHQNDKQTPVGHTKKSRNGLESFSKYFTLNAAIPITIIALVYLCYDHLLRNKSSQQVHVSETVPGISPKSLLVPYTLDHQELLRVRSSNIQKWRKHHRSKVNYNERGVDRRSNLSLEEFWDVYDGMWETFHIPGWLRGDPKPHRRSNIIYKVLAP
ncbi:hypothetical protein LSH36_85g01004 [Paralvinella palmiformis]|uniref:Uncharacterized protein n=1 Tax=Paralvinella palmiformis TaxID=53620 RepID=A0AAD9K374_9ANNE|nr:hypothetical protein LSH36_85g01004 [Paralvinella palmiformis]